MTATYLQSCVHSCNRKLPHATSRLYLPSRHFHNHSTRIARHSSTVATSQDLDPATLLATPTWSVRSLLPTTTTGTPTVTPTQLRHLLRLSALPLPSSPAAEASMIATLESQLHFVRAIQKVDTKGVEPLRSIRDETAAAMSEASIGIERLKHVLESEETLGHCRRPRRRRDVPVDTAGSETWDALGTASQRVGRYFVVRSGKGPDAQGS